MHLKYDEVYKYTVQHCIDTEGVYFLSKFELESAREKFLMKKNINNNRQNKEEE